MPPGSAVQAKDEYPEAADAYAYYPPVPPDYYRPPLAPDYYIPVPYYGPYVRYPAGDDWGARPWVYWGPTICTSGFGRHFGMGICL